MALSDEDRAALRAEWLGEALPEDLARLLEPAPSDQADLRRREELLEYRPRIGSDIIVRARRLILAYAPAAVARLVEVMQDSAPETSRKAAVDLLKHFPRFAVDELAAEAAGADADGRRLTDRLTDDQAQRILSILADARNGLHATPEPEPREGDEPPGG